MIDDGCKYPGCPKRARKTWALVPLCDDHHEVIRAETQRYYNGSVNAKYNLRLEYLKIAKLIPWSRLKMGEVLPDGSLRGH
ncbi:hypothetical protein COLU111180_12170 [Cohnella lubricantis]|uniref:HNH endonuclease n=1 Tax=Cohnella lubricantis TaxID=2163172 RepID=A0A841T3N6_9BACL|nr:hypothetical protein [Cohnella lubricantis]MBB6675944.1 hypothetical protein [Cohnella lubricantis]MBP2117939.1 hypothetical protein [Cohnella lubricantis]